MKKLVYLCLLLSATGCAVYKQDFGCKVNDGLGCSSMSHINKMVDEQQDAESIGNKMPNSTGVRVWYRHVSKDGALDLKPSYVDSKGEKL